MRRKNERNTKKECERRMIQAFPLQNQESGEYDADEEWQLAIVGGRAWAIGNMEIEIWGSNSL